MRLPASLACRSAEARLCSAPARYRSRWHIPVPILNGDGQRDKREPGLPGVTIYLDQNSNGVLDPDERSTVTEAEGFYAFTHVPLGTIRVREVIPEGFQQTFPSLGYWEVTLEPNTTLIEGLDFGNQEFPGELTGTKWNDLNGRW